MWRFLSRLFMVFGVIIFAGAFLFLYTYFWGNIKAGLIMDLIGLFLLQVLIGMFLFFTGDFMLRLDSESKTVDYLLGKYIK